MRAPTGGEQSGDAIEARRSLGTVHSALEASSRRLAGLHDAIKALESALQRAGRGDEDRWRPRLAELYAFLAAEEKERSALRQCLDDYEKHIEAELEQAERQQRYVAEEQDRFLAAVLEEHEAQLAEVSQLRNQAQEKLERFQAQTVELRAQLARAERQRDEARATLRYRSAAPQSADEEVSEPPPSLDFASSPSAHTASTRPAPPLELDPEWDHEVTPAPPPSLEVGPRPHSSSAPPGASRSTRPAASGTPQSSGSDPADRGSNAPASALKRKPDPSERPLVGYSLRAGAIQNETVVRPSKPPRR